MTGNVQGGRVYLGSGQRNHAASLAGVLLAVLCTTYASHLAFWRYKASAAKAVHGLSPARRLDRLRRLCTKPIADDWAAHFGGADKLDLVVMTFLAGEDNVLLQETKWALGITAAQYGVPLVLAGQGKKYGGDKKDKIKGVTDALRFFDDNQKILFLDGTDTLFFNPLSVVEKRVAATDENDVLFMTECNSWPKCYRKQYIQSGHACPPWTKTCFLNSGAFAGTVKNLRRVITTLPKMPIAKIDDDQTQAQVLFMEQEKHDVSMVLDYGNEAFFSMMPCAGKPQVMDAYRATCDESDIIPYGWEPTNKHLLQFSSPPTGPASLSVKLNKTHSSTPAMLHLNGPWWLKKRFKLLFDKNVVSLLRKDPAQQKLLRAFPILIIDSRNDTCKIGRNVGMNFEAEKAVGNIMF